MKADKLTPMEAYNIGDIIDYKVRQLFSNYCELIDEKTNITSYLQGTAKLVLFKGQSVQCRVLAVSEKHPKIELVNISDFEQSDDSLTEEKLTALLASKEISWNTKDFVKLLLIEEKEKNYESECHRWIQSLLNKKIDLKLVRRDCANLLELSNLLNICSYNERDYYQERVTLLIEQIGYYIRAAELIDNEAKEEGEDTPSNFIDGLFNKLRVSGFVYHPSKNFNTLLSLFLRKPDLMNSRIKDFLNIIREKDIKIWEREPFSSALIKLLEFYVRECDGKIDKTKDNKELVENNMLAIAILLLLVKDTNHSGIADYQLNAARLCVLSSYLYTLNPMKLIDSAYYNLFHSKALFPLYSIDNVKLLPNYIASSPCENIDTINSFSQGLGRLQISGEGIHLLPTGERKNLHPVFPKDLGLWKDMQVFLTSKTTTSLSSVKPNDITPYQAIWNEIETEFFNSNKKPVVVVTKNKKQHRLDEIVKITFTRQDPNDKNKFYCQIEDEIGGNGFIYVKEIVPYTISTSLRHYYGSDGSRLVFKAQIIDKEDDMFQFSMLKDLQEYCSNEFYSDDEDIICSVGNIPNSYGMSPAVTKDGVSVSIRNARDFDGVAKGSIVRCRLVGPGKGTFHIECDMLDFCSSDFDLNTAFKNLMENCCIGKIPEKISQQEEEQIMESDKILDESYVKEVIYMIDRLALIDTEYVKSYNYLGFARILSMLIGWESQAAYYKGRMDIITMLHDFAINSKVNEEKLTQLENANLDLFSNNVVLRERFMQLQTVSFIDREEHNEELFKLAYTNPSLKKLASLVLAYNITKSNKLESSATNIHNKIIQLLNLKGYETGLKLYGTGKETEEIEYKTSIVFFAEDNSNLPNQEKQMDEILKVINSFLNTRGGTLYVGVNNFGYGVGVEDDLNSPLYYGDKDKYVRSIVDAVSLEWGNNIATTYIGNISFDEENLDKDVLIIEILPYREGLPYHGDWYVRKAGSKRKLSQTDFEKYQKVARRLQIPTVDIEVSQSVMETEHSKEKSDVASYPSSNTLKDEKINTSRIRSNILKNWEENYEEPIAFFKFLSGGKFKKIDTYDYDEESLLTLAVKEEEQKGFLLLGYENGHIVKVSVEELLEYKNREYSRNTDCKLVFATIAKKDDAVLSITEEDKKLPKTMMRLDRLSNFDEKRLNDTGIQPYKDGLARKVLAYEVIPQEHIEDFYGILDKPITSLGNPKNTATKDMIEKLHSWGINEI